MLTAGAQPQTEAGLVHDDVGRDEQDDGNGGRQVEILENQVVPETGAVHRGEAEGIAGDAHPVGNEDRGQALALDGPGHDDGEGGRELVQRRAADGLVGLQVDGRKAQQQRKNHAGDARHQNGNEHRQLRMCGTEAALVQALQRKAGEQRANDHHALKCDVDDAGMLTEHAAHGDEQQRHCEQNGHTDNVGSDHHFAAPSFPLWPETALVMMPRISRAKAAR